MEHKETKIQRICSGMRLRTEWIFTILFGVAALLFFGMVYPHHLHYQEQYQLFLFDSNYVWEIVKLPGGVADLLGRFCTQFFLFAWVGAFIIALLLMAVQLLTLRLIRWGRFYGLSFVPSFLLWIFLLDENALLGGVWAVLLTLLASWVFDKLTSDDKFFTLSSSIFILFAVPMLYWMVGPVSLLFFLLQVLRPKCSAWYYAVFALFALILVILSFYIPVPAGNLWFGIHYYRYPTVIPILLWAATLSIFLLVFIVRAFCPQGDKTKKISKSVSTSKSPILRFFTLHSSFFTFLLVAIGMGFLVWKNTNFKAEKVMKYDFMACHQQWNRILETINAEKPNNQIGVTVQNLALAMHGVLLNHMFEYNQNGIAGLLPDVQSDATSPMPTAEAFYQLGMINVAQRTVFEAQEAILDFQKSGRCYKRLAQTNLINGSYEVARKYLTALRKTLFYREWANKTLPLLGNEKAIAKHPDYGRLRKWAYKDDFYFSDHVTPEMLESLYSNNSDNRMAYQYLLAYYLLTGDREGYNNFISKYNE